MSSFFFSIRIKQKKIFYDTFIESEKKWGREEIKKTKRFYSNNQFSLFSYVSSCKE